MLRSSLVGVGAAVVLVTVACSAPVREAKEEVRQARMSSDQVCELLTKSLEASIEGALAIAKQRSGAESLKIEIVKIKCQGHALIADVMFSAEVGDNGKRVGMIVVSSLRLLPDGTIEAAQLGVREAD